MARPWFTVPTPLVPASPSDWETHRCHLLLAHCVARKSVKVAVPNDFCQNVRADGCALCSSKG